MYAAVLESNKPTVLSLVNNAPDSVEEEVLKAVRYAMKDVISITDLLERLEQFNDFGCYMKIKEAFIRLQKSDITQFAMNVRDDSYPCLLDVWAGSEWRPDEEDTDDHTWFVLGECFCCTEEEEKITEAEFYARLDGGLDLFVSKH